MKNWFRQNKSKTTQNQTNNLKATLETIMLKKRKYPKYRLTETALQAEKEW